MGMIEKIFGKREQPQALKNAKLFRMLEGYTPVWSSFSGSIYEADLIRASLDAWGRHAGKLKPNLKGAALPELQKRLKVKPNQFREWSQFLYQTATVLGVRNSAFLVKTRSEDGTPTGVINIVPESWELVEYADEPWIRFALSNNKRRAERLAEVGILVRHQYKSELFGDPFFLSSTLRKKDMMNARTPNEAKMHIGTMYPPVALSTTPIRRGTRQSPIF